MIPSNDYAPYLRETLASVLAQDPGPERMQVKVVDDASSDRPESVRSSAAAGSAFTASLATSAMWRSSTPAWSAPAASS